MANKQTAVEWLKNNLIINGSGATTTFSELFAQAKAMEKEQIKDAFNNGYSYDLFHGGGKQYYNQTYGK